MAVKRSRSAENPRAVQAMRILKDWQPFFIDRSLPIDQVDQPIWKPKRPALRPLASDPASDAYAASDAEFRVWRYRDQVTAALCHLEVLPLVRAVVNSLYDASTDLEPADIAARTVLFIADAVDALEMAGGTIKRWEKVGWRTELLEGLGYAEMALIKVRSTLRQIDEVAPPLREMHRRHRRTIDPGAVVPSIFSKASRTEMMDSLTRLEAEIKILKDVLKADIGARRQRGGSIAKYRESLFEVDSLAAAAFGDGVDAGLRRRLVFGVLRVFDPNIHFEDDSIRKVL